MNLGSSKHTFNTPTLIALAEYSATPQTKLNHFVGSNSMACSSSFKLKDLNAKLGKHFVYDLTEYILISHRLQFWFNGERLDIYSFWYILSTQLSNLNA